MSEYQSIIDKSYWLKTGQPGHGLIEIPSSASEEETGQEGPRKRNSYDKLDSRSKAEKLLFYFVGQGNVEGMREVMRRYPGKYSVNAKSRNGYDLLMCAVVTGDVGIVKSVLREVSPQTIVTQGGIIKAVRWNKVNCLMEILHFEEERKGGGDEKGRWLGLVAMASMEWKRLHGGGKAKTEYLHMAEFGSDPTPLMMAAIWGHYEMIGLLYARGERMPKLHYPSCTCRTCQSFRESGDGKDLERIRKRIALLEAMGSVEWLIFMSGQDGNWDPIWEVIRVKAKIEKCIKEELEWKIEYEQVLEKVEKVPGIMVNMCTTAEEVKILLYGGSSEWNYPLVRLAVDSGMKEFVAEASVQFTVEQEFSGWRPKTRIKRFVKMLAAFILTICFPVVNLVLWPMSLCGGLHRQTSPFIRYLISPESRFYMNFGSYQFYLVTLLRLVVKETSSQVEQELDETTFWLRCILVIFVISHGVSHFCGLRQNPKYFYIYTWNRIELLICILFCGTFTFWFWEDVLGFEKLIPENSNLITSFPFLSSLDTLTFSFGVTLSILYLFRYTILFSHFGRVQTKVISLGKGKWKTIMLYILLASVTLTLVGAKFIRKGTWEPYVVTALLIVDTIVATFIYVTGTGLFGSGHVGGSTTRSLSVLEWRYQRAVEWIRLSREHVGLTPPFNLLPICGCNAFQEDDEMSREEIRKQYPYLMRKLFERYFRRKMNI